MKPMFFFPVGILLVTGCTALDEKSVPTSSSRLVELFDGKTFNGWEGNLDWFRIEDGNIVAGTLEKAIPHNEFLCTTRKYGDFELTLKFRVDGSEQANAGVQIRSRRIPDHHEVIGYQADIGQQYWGALYDESRRGKVLAGPDPEDLSRIAHQKGWNDYRILCQGRRIQLFLNGHQTVDYMEEDESIAKTGVIGLQVHGGPPVEIWYRDISIRELP